MDNTTFALIVGVINAPSVALLIKGWLDHRKWQKENLKQDLQWEINVSVGISNLGRTSKPSTLPRSSGCR
jgi:hypothetical protein